MEGTRNQSTNRVINQLTEDAQYRGQERFGVPPHATLFPPSLGKATSCAFENKDVHGFFTPRSSYRVQLCQVTRAIMVSCANKKNLTRTSLRRFGWRFNRAAPIHILALCRKGSVNVQYEAEEPILQTTQERSEMTSRHLVVEPVYSNVFKVLNLTVGAPRECARMSRASFD